MVTAEVSRKSERLLNERRTTAVWRRRHWLMLSGSEEGEVKEKVREEEGQ